MPSSPAEPPQDRYGTDCVRDAIKEAVIYEKRSLAYIRRVLEAWRRNGRSTDKSSYASPPSEEITTDFPASDGAMKEEFVWPPPDLSDPAVAAWEKISTEMPQLGRFKQTVTPVSLIGSVLTVSVPNSRTFNALTWGLNYFVTIATEIVLGKGALLKVKMAEEESGATIT